MFQGFTRKIANALAKPPKGKVDIMADNAQAYALEHQGKAYLAQESHRVNTPQATLVGEGTPSPYWQPFDASHQAICLDNTHKGFRFCGQHLIDPQNKVVVSPDVAQNSLTILQQKLPTDIEKLKGTVAYLSHSSPRHYGRWVRDTLPLLAIYEQYLGLDQIDYFYVGDLSRIPDFINEFFDYLGISPHKIIANPCRGTRTLRAFLPQASSPYYNHLTYTYARQLVTAQIDLSDNCCYHPRVYIARGKVAHRKVKNQEAVYEVLRPYDFELRVLDNLKVREQAQIFYHADVLIAPHGAALTNLMYGKKGNKVLEILPNDCNNAQYFSLAAYAQMHYFAMYSPPLQNPILDVCNQDIEVNLKLLETFCRQHC